MICFHEKLKIPGLKRDILPGLTYLIDRNQNLICKFVSKYFFDIFPHSVLIRGERNEGVSVKNLLESDLLIMGPGALQIQFVSMVPEENSVQIREIKYPLSELIEGIPQILNLRIIWTQTLTRVE
jgi:hypothetical protein